MNFNGILIVFGIIGLLALTALIIGFFNKSKTVGGWFSYLLKQIGVILTFLLFLDFQLLAMLLAILVVWVAVYIPLSWGENNLSQPWYYLLICFSFIYFFLWLWLTGNKSFYSKFGFRKNKFENIKKINLLQQEARWVESIDLILKEGMGFLIPLMIIIGLVMLGITCFTALTNTLYENGNIEFTTTIEKDGMDVISNFYLWHFLDLIPQIKVNETLNWEVPLDYADKSIASLLLIFKSLMAYIVIARFYTWNKWRKNLKIKS